MTNIFFWKLNTPIPGQTQRSAVRQMGFGGSKVLLAWALVALVSALQWLAWADSLGYDALLKLTPPALRTPQVLMVSSGHHALLNDAPAALPGHPDWAQLAQSWLTGGARRVGFGIRLDSPQQAQLAPLVAAGKVVLAAEGTPDAADESAADVGKAADKQTGKQARQRFWQQLAGTAPGQQIWPDYAFPVSQLPAITRQRAQTEGIIAPLLQDKIILVGYANAPELRQLTIPGQRTSVSQLQYDALQVDSLLQNARIRHGNGLIRMLAAGGFALLLLLALQRPSFKFGLSLLLLGLLMSWGAAWLLLATFKIWLPLPEMTLLALATFVAVYYDKIHGDDIKIRALIASTSGKLHKLALPPSIFQSQDHWQFILRLIDQTLHVNRVILLEKTPDNNHLREVQALGSDLATIRELRRDYRREPYSSAINARGLTEVENFLAHGNAQEKQFVLPLLLNGEVLGFLAFGVLQEQWQHFYQQQNALAPMAGQIANLLYQRRLWLEQESAGKAPLSRFFEDGNAAAFKKLTQGVAMMERRLAILEQSFAHASHAAIVYDLFGRVLLVNQPMRQRLAHSGFKSNALNDMSATDFVARLSGKGLDAARQAMQDLIIHGSKFSWPVNLPDLLDDHLVLRASVLQHEPQPGTAPVSGSNATQHPQPFNISGVLVEVMDMGEMMLQHDARSEIRMQAAHFLHQELDKLPALLRALNHQKLNASMAKLITALLQDKAKNIQTIMEKSRLLLEDQASNQVLCYPVDVHAVLQKALLELAAQLDKKNLHVQIQWPNPGIHAFAVPKDLRFCLCAILHLLILDASSDSVLHIAASLEQSCLRLQFTNAGFGMSNQRLQASLQDPLAREQAPLFAQAFEAIGLIAAWDGTLQLQSEIGEGMQASLRLAAFHWQENDAQVLAGIKQADNAPRMSKPRLVVG
jgi:CHASE2 domain-containing sensor protein